MTEIDGELSVSKSVGIVAVWTTVFAGLDILAPPLVSNVVLSGIAGGISLVVSLVYVRESET